MASVLFSDGFESGNVDAWSWSVEGLAINQKVPVHHGTYSLQCTATTGRAWVCYVTDPGENDVYFRCYCYLENLPPNTTNIHILRLGNNDELIEIIADYTGVSLGWAVYSSVTGQTFYAANIMAKNWYCVEIRRKVGAPGLVEAWIDGVKIHSNNENVTGTTIYHYAGIVAASDFTSVVYTDCAVLADGYIGPHTIFSDGFESGDFSAWIGVTDPSCTVVNTFPSQGKFCAKFVTDYGEAYQDILTNRTIAHLRMYFQIPNLPNNGNVCSIMGMFDSSFTTYLIIFVKNNGGTPQLLLSTMSGAKATNVTLDLNTYHCIETEWVKGAGGTGVATVWLNGVVISTENDTLDYTASFRVGEAYCDEDGFVLYVDDVILSDAYIGLSDNPRAFGTFIQRKNR